MVSECLHFFWLTVYLAYVFCNNASLCFYVDLLRDLRTDDVKQRQLKGDEKTDNQVNNARQSAW